MQSEGGPPKNTIVHGRERPTGSGSSGEQAHSTQSSGSRSELVINKGISIMDLNTPKIIVGNLFLWVW